MVPERTCATVSSPITPSSIAAELTQAVHDLNARGLFEAAQWAAEQLVGLELHSSQPAASDFPPQHQQATQIDCPSQGQQNGSICRPRSDPDEHHPQYLLARAYFQSKEYRRSAHALSGLDSQLPTFLRLYATYLAGEKRREEERVEKGGPMGRPGDAVHPELEALQEELARRLPAAAAARGQLGEGAAGVPGGPQARSGPAAAAGAAPDAAAANGSWAGSVRQDPFLLYLHGVVLSAQGRTTEALDALVASLRGYPCNWSAWLAIKAICFGGEGPQRNLAAAPAAPGRLHGFAAPTTSVASAAPTATAATAPCLSLPLPASLPPHWVREFFQTAVALAAQQNQEALSRLQGLAQVFRGSLSVESWVAQAHYNLQNFDEAQAVYEDLLGRDPYRLEDTDTFSNILFVKEAAAPLSVLAHRVAATDKYRPETCCVIGNYYSMQGSHERAVEYFRRALRLNPRYLAAWTLMGHEYMEVKNAPAAIDAYRRAVDVSPQDFRAWYGLGQAYELLKMPYYALYYFQRAAQLRPTDARMWCAVAQCFNHEQVGLQDGAVWAYQRAVAHEDPDGIAVHKLAKLYESRGDMAAAERMYRHSLMRLQHQGAPALLSQDAVEAITFLATYCKDTGRLVEAEELCSRLLDVGGLAKERAKMLAREIRLLQQQQETTTSLHGVSSAGGAGPVAGASGGGVATHGSVGGAASAGAAPAGPLDAATAQPHSQSGALATTSGAVGEGGVGGSARGGRSPGGGTGTILPHGSGSTSPSPPALHHLALGGVGKGGLHGLGAVLGVDLAVGLGPEGVAVLDLEFDGGEASEEAVMEAVGGCDPLVVLAVMQQLQIDRASAVAILHQAGGDPVAAVRMSWELAAAAASMAAAGTEGHGH